MKNTVIFTSRFVFYTLSAWPDLNLHEMHNSYLSSHCGVLKHNHRVTMSVQVTINSTLQVHELQSSSGH